LSVAATRYPRALRLLKPADFQRVFKQARYKSGDRYLTVLARPNGLGHPRLGMAISIRNAGNAVARNRVKRVIRECFRLSQARLDSLDLVIVGRAGIATRSNRQLVESLQHHWQKITDHAQTDVIDD